MNKRERDAQWIEVTTEASQRLFSAPRDEISRRDPDEDLMFDLDLKPEALRLLKAAPKALSETKGAFSRGIRRQKSARCFGMLAPPRKEEWRFTKDLSVSFTKWIADYPEASRRAITTYLDHIQADGSIVVSTSWIQSQRGREELQAVKRLLTELRKRQFPQMTMRLHYRSEAVHGDMPLLLKRIGIPVEQPVHVRKILNPKPVHGKQLQIFFCWPDARRCRTGVKKPGPRASEGFRYLMVSAFAVRLWSNLPLFSGNRFGERGRRIRGFPLPAKHASTPQQGELFPYLTSSKRPITKVGITQSTETVVVERCA